MNSVRIEKGNHNPNFITKLHTYLQSYKNKAQVMFIKASSYSLPAGEQADWNKLVGRKAFFRTNGSWNPLNWEFGRFEQFWVWRYYNHKFEIAKYVRENNYFFWHEKEVATEGWWKDLDLTWFSYWLPSGAYFGGSNPAPKRVYWHLNTDL